MTGTAHVPGPYAPREELRRSVAHGFGSAAGLAVIPWQVIAVSAPPAALARCDGPP